jgi:hypothetical protein
MIESSCMRWAVRVALMREVRIANETLFGKPDGKILLGRGGRRWEILLKCSWTTGFRFLAGAVTFFSSPPSQDWLWGPPSPLSHGYFHSGYQMLRTKLCPVMSDEIFRDTSERGERC